MRDLDLLWLVIATALVFIMQGGFLLYEIGIVRKRNVVATAMKNCIDWTVVCLSFFFVGFGLMFGQSLGGLFGTSISLDTPKNLISLLFFTAFAATALTIVSGAMAERTSFISYLVLSLLVGLLIFPVVGHWVWGSTLIPGNEPWLYTLGFRDYAGASVVHGVGAWVALVGVWMIGPRLGRFNNKGEPRRLESHSLAFSALGMFVLWFGWWGFNGGSSLHSDVSVVSVLINTNLCGASAGLAAFVHSFFFSDRRDLYQKYLGAMIGGLVAVTASANLISPLGAIFIGFVAGFIHNWCFDFLLYRLKLDDAVGAISAHGACGVWGTLALALFANAELLPLPRSEQFLVQVLGCVAIFAWSTTCAWLAFSLLRLTVGLRVSPQLEREGLCIEREFERSEIEAIDEELLESLRQKEQTKSD